MALARRVALLAVSMSAVLLVTTDSSTGTARPLRYIALGDSFSSGEGVPPYRKSTDRHLPPHALCHRPYRADRALVANRRSSPGSWSFWACSGARVGDMWNFNRQNPVEVAQVDRVAPPGKPDPDIDLITLTIGG